MSLTSFKNDNVQAPAFAAPLFTAPHGAWGVPPPEKAGLTDFKFEREGMLWPLRVELHPGIERDPFT